MVQGTTGIDIVAGGHNHIVIDPPQVLQDCSADPNEPRLHLGGQSERPGEPQHAPAGRPDPPGPDQPPLPVPAGVHAAQRAHHAIGRVLQVRRAARPDALEQSRRGLSDRQPGGLRPEQRLRGHLEHVPDLPDHRRSPTTRSSTISSSPTQTSLDVEADLDILVGFSPNGANRTRRRGATRRSATSSPRRCGSGSACRPTSALTNSTGIRTDLNPGPVDDRRRCSTSSHSTTRSRRWSSPGREVRELFDFVARTAASRGCVSVAPDCRRARPPRLLGVHPHLRPDTSPASTDDDCRRILGDGACDMTPTRARRRRAPVTACAERDLHRRRGPRIQRCNADADCCRLAHVPATPAAPPAHGCDPDALDPGPARQCFRNPGQPAPSGPPSRSRTSTSSRRTTTSPRAARATACSSATRPSMNTRDRAARRADRLHPQGNPCGYDHHVEQSTVAPPPCSTDSRLLGPADFVCACPGHVTPATTPART